jgi:hypothetical protein
MTTEELAIRAGEKQMNIIEIYLEGLDNSTKRLIELSFRTAYVEGRIEAQREAIKRLEERYAKTFNKTLQE